MTLARLLAATLVACSALAVAQQKNEAPAIPAQATDASKPPTAASSEPWKFIPNQLADASSGKDPLNRLQIDKYKVFRSKTSTRTLLVGPEADAGVFLTGMEGLDGTCYAIRSYVVARDSKDSDSTHPVSYSTCQPASRYRVRTTEMRTDSVDR
jgi:hypothetical protein